jgi:hypothetical protein
VKSLATGDVSDYERLGTPKMSIISEKMPGGQMDAMMTYGDARNEDKGAQFMQTAVGALLSSQFSGIGSSGERDGLPDKPSERKFYNDLCLGYFSNTGVFRVDRIIPKHHIVEWADRNPHGRKPELRQLASENEYYFKKLMDATQTCLDFMMDHPKIQAGRTLALLRTAKYRDQDAENGRDDSSDDEEDPTGGETFEKYRDEIQKEFATSANLPYDVKVKESNLRAAVTNCLLSEKLHYEPGTSLAEHRKKAEEEADWILHKDNPDYIDPRNLAVVRMVCRCWKPPESLSMGKQDAYKALKKEQDRLKTRMDEIREEVEESEQSKSPYEQSQIADRRIFDEMYASSWQYNAIGFFDGNKKEIRHDPSVKKSDRIWQRRPIVDAGALVSFVIWLKPYSQVGESGKYGVRMNFLPRVRLHHPAVYHVRPGESIMRSIAFGSSASDIRKEAMLDVDDEEEDEASSIDTSAFPTFHADPSPSLDSQVVSVHYDPSSQSVVTKPAPVDVEDDEPHRDHEPRDELSEYAEALGSFRNPKKRTETSRKSKHRRHASPSSDDGIAKLAKAAMKAEDPPKRQRRLTSEE